MPRPPTYYHPLRNFRSSLGLSQPAFGARIGVSGVTIQQIENGLLPMSVKLALRICIIFKTKPREFLSAETCIKFKRQLEPMIEFYHYLVEPTPDIPIAAPRRHQERV